MPQLVDYDTKERIEAFGDVRNCPFCGSDGSKPHRPISLESWEVERSGKPALCYQIVCEWCFCNGPHSNSAEEAVRTWNKRAQREVVVTGPTAWHEKRPDDAVLQ